MSPLEPEIPPAGEEIHLPGPTIKPLLLAVGITLTIIGTTISPIFLVGGAIMTVAVMASWIADTRRDIAELPLDHDAH